MSVNPWMNSPSAGLSGEQELYQDLVDENIAAGGVNVMYLPKDQINLDELFGESTIAEYKKGFEIEMYISNVTGFNGDGDLFSKFGLGANDEATLLVSVRRFEVEGKDYGLKKPLEEDLIYMPLSSSMWRIRKVKQDEQYFQFGRNYTWRLEVGLFNPTHETFEGDTFNPRDFDQAAPEVDELSLNRVFGVEEDSVQEQQEYLVNEAEKSIPTFDPNNPFGG